MKKLHKGLTKAIADSIEAYDCKCDCTCSYCGQHHGTIFDYNEQVGVSNMKTTAYSLVN